MTGKHNKGKERLTIGGVSGKFRRHCDIYRVFGEGFTQDHTFTDQDLVDLFNNESYGTLLRPKNGFALGKKWMNVTIAMWNEDISSGILRKAELYEDGKFPHWWLDNVLN